LGLSMAKFLQPLFSFPPPLSNSSGREAPGIAAYSSRPCKVTLALGCSFWVCPPPKPSCFLSTIAKKVRVLSAQGSRISRNPCHDPFRIFFLFFLLRASPATLAAAGGKSAREVPNVDIPVWRSFSSHPPCASVLGKALDNKSLVKPHVFARCNGQVRYERI